MRICLSIHHDLDPDSGAPGVTFRLAEQYRRYGHAVEVLDFERLLPRRLPPHMCQIAFPWAVATWLLANGSPPFDVIDTSTGDASLLVSLRNKIPAARGALLVTRSHGLEHIVATRLRAEASTVGEPLSWKYPLYHGGYRLWEVARSLRGADLALFLNAVDRDYAVTRLGVQEKRAVLVRNGVSQVFLGLRAPEPSADGGRIAVIGSYIPRKGTVHAAAALAGWLPRHPNWSVTFLGTGVSTADVHNDYEAALRERILVIPRYANKELPMLLEGHQIHLFPTLAEGWPTLSLLESMACGLVPVVSNVDGMADVISDGVNALVVPPGEPAAIVNALDRLAGDSAMLDHIRLNAHRFAQGYGWGEVAAEQLQNLPASSWPRRLRKAEGRSGFVLRSI